MLYRITDTNDDGRNNAPVAGADTWVNNNVSVGQKNFAADDKAIGIRFTGVAIPQGATIVSAKLIFTCKTTSTANGKVATIYGADYDNFAGFANNALPEDSGTAPFDDVTRTTASVVWIFTDLTAEVVYETPDIATIVQEIVNRAGWASGNAMAFAIRPIGTGTIWSKDFYDYSDSAAKAVMLDVLYEGEASTPSHVIPVVEKHKM